MCARVGERHQFPPQAQGRAAAWSRLPARFLARLCPSRAPLGHPEPGCIGKMVLPLCQEVILKVHLILCSLLAYGHACSRHSLELASWKNNGVLRENIYSLVGTFLPSAGSFSAHITAFSLLPLRARKKDKRFSSQQCYFSFKVLLGFHIWLLISRAIDVTDLDRWIETYS